MQNSKNASLSKDRILSLVTKKFLSAQDGDNAIANYKTATAKVQQAMAALDQANLNLEYSKITSPTSGGNECKRQRRRYCCC